MDQNIFTVSQAVKLVEAESHVLRFWEEELHLKIARNERGHRIYTEDDIMTFLSIKEWKKQGYHLKDMEKLIEEAKADEEVKSGNMISGQGKVREEERRDIAKADQGKTGTRSITSINKPVKANMDAGKAKTGKENPGTDRAAVEKTIIEKQKTEPLRASKKRNINKANAAKQETGSGKKQPAKTDAESEKYNQFRKIMNRVIEETIAENHSLEGRYKKVDATIRHHQRFRKLVAASKDE
ncbi:MAG: MerR family transcriptional regulator [Lachnospiraceae bacterium]|nr:MerR family transcriptional regulator [Lachnospiraceae bacterium]